VPRGFAPSEARTERRSYPQKTLAPKFPEPVFLPQRRQGGNEDHPCHAVSIKEVTCFSSVSRGTRQHGRFGSRCPAKIANGRLLLLASAARPPSPDRSSASTSGISRRVDPGHSRTIRAIEDEVFAGVLGGEFVYLFFCFPQTFCRTLPESITGIPPREMS
jgi:hypothetical protein